ncbi:MAG: DoxX family protein [Rhodobacteraceae bacterium]|nr:DoxX family protein [Paracoccaceae bacterium]
MLSLYDSTTARLSKDTIVLPTLARFVFAAVLLLYFWNSAMTKLGDGLLAIFRPGTGAYVQIFPKAMEAVSYDVSQLSMFHWLVALAGTWSEFLLPAMILVGLLTRFAALGMIGFIVVQSLTDVFAHGMADAKTLGVLFDRLPDSAILDQRLLWVTVLLILVMKGAGPLSLDRLLVARRG